MARSTQKSLTAQAAQAARAVISRRTSRAAAEPEEPPAAVKKAPAKKAPAKKTSAKKASATKTSAKKTAAEKTPAKKTPAKKTVAAAKTAPQKKAAPAKKAAPQQKAAPPKKAAAKKAPATSTSRTSRSGPSQKATPVSKNPSPTRKAPASALVVKEGEDAWTKAELDELLGELHEQREHSLAIVTDQETELTGLMRDSGDGAGQDQADMGATSFERDHELTVLNNERDKLAQIDRALARIDDGSYGVCESCGEPIGKMRLMAFPRATLCMTCKQREERR